MNSTQQLHILATGTTRGIGAAIRAELESRGARVIGHGRSAAGRTQIGADLEQPGTAEGLWQEALDRLDAILTAMRDIGLSADGELGDYRPLRALDAAVQSFRPDPLVIAEARSAWLRLGMVDRVRAAYPIPVLHVVPGQSALSSA